MPLNNPDEVEQGTAAWRHQRAGSVTGSCVAEIMTKAKSGNKESKTRQGYRMKLLAERITGMLSAEVNAPSLSWGKEHEPAAVVAYELYKAEHGENVFVERVGYIPHKTLDWVGTSPDGFVGEQGIIEVKCPHNSAVHLLTVTQGSKALATALALSIGEDPSAWGTMPMPDDYIPQVQFNLWVTERRWCDFISYDPRVPAHLRLYVARVERDEKFIATMAEAVVKFLEELEGNVESLLTPNESPQT